jgi:hypothetical protein
MGRETPAERLSSMWRLVAFCGRYGHQDAATLLQMTTSDLVAFAKALGKLMGEEKDSLHERAVTGG